MVKFLSINFFSWISSIFVGFFKSSSFFVSLCIKIIEAQRAKIYNSYKNTRLKILKMNAAIWFNKICKTNSLPTAAFEILV